MASVYIKYIIASLVPSLFAMYASYNYRWNHAKRYLVIHIFLALSVILSLYFLQEVSLFGSEYWMYVSGVLALIYMLFVGKNSGLYFISSILQQGSMCLVTKMLMGGNVSLWLNVILVGLPYVLAHDFSYKIFRKRRVLIVALWGIGTISLYRVYEDLWLNIFIHFAVGGILLYKKIICRT